MGRLRPAAPPITETLELGTCERGPSLTGDELVVAATKIDSARAPGLDGVPGTIVKQAVKYWTGGVMRCFAQLLNTYTFPEAMVFLASALCGRRRNFSWVCVGSVRIEVRTSINYLGLTLDSEWSFRPHVRKIVPRVRRVVEALCRILPNLHGPCESKRRLYSSVINSMLLYGAPIWWRAVVKDLGVRKCVNGLQRAVALRLCCAYRTVSFHAAMMIARVIPLHHLAPRLAEAFWTTRSTGGACPPQLRALTGAKAKREAIAAWKAEEINLLGTEAPVIETTLDDARKWVAFQSFSGLVMSSKEDEERKRKELVLHAFGGGALFFYLISLA
ncbi:hypothetical protein M0802_012016 [Mischocyttarus mexicanus]|nr:hypothetical protein M0802_012016 [Mischocyttarus mexicanus]